MREKKGGAKEMYNKQHTPSSFTLSGGGTLTPSPPTREREREKKKSFVKLSPGRGEEKQSEFRREAVKV